MIDIMRTVCEISVYHDYIGVHKIMVFICRHYENCPGSCVLTQYFQKRNLNLFKKRSEGQLKVINSAKVQKVNYLLLIKLIFTTFLSATRTCDLFNIQSVSAFILPGGPLDMIDIMRTVCEITRWAPCYDIHYENCM
jgi:hypothetical protein